MEPRYPRRNKIKIYFSREILSFWMNYIDKHKLLEEPAFPIFRVIMQVSVFYVFHIGSILYQFEIINYIRRRETSRFYGDFYGDLHWKLQLSHFGFLILIEKHHSKSCSGNKYVACKNAYSLLLFHLPIARLKFGISCVTSTKWIVDRSKTMSPRIKFFFSLFISVGRF